MSFLAVQSARVWAGRARRTERASQLRWLGAASSPSEDHVPENDGFDLLELVSELEQVVRRHLLEARDHEQRIHVPGPGPAALGLEQRRRVDHDERERRLAQLIEQALERVRRHERR